MLLGIVAARHVMPAVLGIVPMAVLLRIVAVVFAMAIMFAMASVVVVRAVLGIVPVLIRIMALMLAVALVVTMPAVLGIVAVVFVMAPVVIMNALLGGVPVPVPLGILGPVAVRLVSVARLIVAPVGAVVCLVVMGLMSMASVILITAIGVVVGGVVLAKAPGNVPSLLKNSSAWGQCDPCHSPRPGGRSSCGSTPPRGLGPGDC